MSASGATTASTSRGDRLKAWWSHHRLVSSGTLKELLAAPLSSLMTWLVIGIALGLPLILFIVLQNVSLASGDWGGKPRLSFYLTDTTKIKQARALRDQIAERAEVDEVIFISADDALKEFQQRSGFAEVLNSLERNPLPHVLEVVPLDADPIRLTELIANWETLESVDHISVDLKWLERLFALLAFGQRLVVALALVLSAGVMLIMGNTIRLAIESRRAEIEVVKLVGGTDAFVRRPFLYLGFWYGVGGAVLALLLAEASLFFLAGPVELLAQSYSDDFALQGPGLLQCLLLLLVGAALGVLGAVLAVSRHLADIEPG